MGAAGLLALQLDALEAQLVAASEVRREGGLQDVRLSKSYWAWRAGA